MIRDPKPWCLRKIAAKKPPATICDRRLWVWQEQWRVKGLSDQKYPFLWNPYTGPLPILTRAAVTANGCRKTKKARTFRFGLLGIRKPSFWNIWMAFCQVSVCAAQSVQKSLAITFALPWYNAGDRIRLALPEFCFIRRNFLFCFNNLVNGKAVQQKTFYM